MEIGKLYHYENNIKCQSKVLAEEEENTKTTPVQVPKTPTEAMEFLTRSWSLSASELSKALNDKLLPLPSIQCNAGLDFTEEQNNSAYSPRFSSKDFANIKHHNRGKTMKSYLKDQKEKKKEEDRCQKAQAYAATSVAGVAAAVAAITASKGNGDSSMHTAISSAAVLVASHCMEKAVEMGARREQVLSVIQSSVNVRSNGDIRALAAAAATALRGTATLQARLHKDIHNATSIREREDSIESFSPLSFVSEGGELLKRTRKGDLCWKHVSMYMNPKWQVVVKMNDKHIVGTFVKNKKSIVEDVCINVTAWPGREKDNQREYFGIITPKRGIEFECSSGYEKQMWTKGIQQMLEIHVNKNGAMTT